MKPIFAIFAIALMGCSNSNDSKVTLEQTRAASQVRSAWEKELRPVSMETELEGVARISAKVTQEGKVDFVPFRFDGKSFIAENPSWTADTASAVCGAFPVSLSDTLDLSAPFSERLFGKESGRSIGERLYIKMNFKSSMALLRFNIESNNLKDVLEALTLMGSEAATTGKYSPYNGRWTEIGGKGMPCKLRVDRLLNGGGNHDFYLIPADAAQSISLVALVNGKEFVFENKIPPLAAGSMTQINLELGKQLIAKSSWVDNERKIEIKSVNQVDTVKVGNYLRKDGYIVAKRDTLCVAIVIETDGKHGKAVAIEDYQSLCTFGYKTLTSNILFQTIDGKRTEGVINDNDASDEEYLVFKPDMPYSDKCAFGYMDGARLTNALRNTIVKHEEASMLTVTEKHPSSYVPSLGEMAKLYYLLQPYSHAEVGSLIEPLSGEYATSSESTEHTFYGIAMDKGIVMSNYSKQYAQLKLRLFYLF